jgi:hypothetical protein
MMGVKSMGKEDTKPSDNIDKQRESSIKSLMRLYSTVAALGLTAAMYKMVNDRAEDVVVNWRFLPFLGAFLVTMIPFYHGAMLHLNHMCHNKNNREMVILINFIMLFAESCLLVGMAFLLPSHEKFAWALVTLLGVDVIWGILCACFNSQGKTGQPSESRWAVLNFFAGAVLLVFLVLQQACQCLFTELQLGILLFIWAFVRSGIDYIWCWELYFPPLNNPKDSDSE